MGDGERLRREGIRKASSTCRRRTEGSERSEGAPFNTSQAGRRRATAGRSPHVLDSSAWAHPKQTLDVRRRSWLECKRSRRSERKQALRAPARDASVRTEARLLPDLSHVDHHRLPVHHELPCPRSTPTSPNVLRVSRAGDMIGRALLSGVGPRSRSAHAISCTDGSGSVVSNALPVTANVAADSVLRRPKLHARRRHSPVSGRNPPSTPPVCDTASWCFSFGGRSLVFAARTSSTSAWM